MRRVAMAGLSALMLVACWSCQGRDAAPAPARMQTVMVTQPRRQDAIRQITLPGDLTGFFQATLYAKVTGYLSKINVDKGDWIRSGEVLAEIEVPSWSTGWATNRQHSRLTSSPTSGWSTCGRAIRGWWRARM